jgi:hypothetical protein
MSIINSITGLFQKPKPQTARVKEPPSHVSSARQAPEVSGGDTKILEAWMRSGQIDIPSNLTPKTSLKSKGMDFFA